MEIKVSVDINTILEPRRAARCSFLHVLPDLGLVFRAGVLPRIIAIDVDEWNHPNDTMLHHIVDLLIDASALEEFFQERAEKFSCTCLAWMHQ